MPQLRRIARRSYSAAQAHGKPAALIGPGCRCGESGFRQHRFRLAGPVLVAVFRVDGFARRKIHFQIERRQTHALRHAAHKVHLDARCGDVPQRQVREGLRVEVRVQFAVEAREQVAVEGRGDASRSS